MKKLSAVLLALCLMISATGCGNTSAPENKEAAPKEEAGKEFTIAMTTFNDSEESSVDYYNGMEAAIADAEANGIKINVVKANSEGDASKQVTALENFIVQQVDAIVFSPIDADAVVGVVNEARAAGIMVIVFDQQVNTEADAQVTIDNTAVGTLMGETMYDAIGGSGKVLVVETPPAVITCRQRSDGAIAAMKEKGLEVVTCLAESPTRDKEMTVVENALQADPDCKGIIGIDADTTIAALLAAESQNYTDMVVIGPDTVAEMRDILAEDRQLYAGIDTLHHEMPYKAMETCIQMLLGEEGGDAQLDGFVVVSDENIEGYVPK